MPLNKLDNFIKNTEGRILYVSPSDLDSTDSISNQGNSLAQPFKTLQRALLESARFSYLKGNSNDAIEKTTILLMPGEHTIDNRPGYALKDVSGSARVVTTGGQELLASAALTLNLNTNFDINQEDNILYKFNSVYGGVIIPRGTSVVGLDLRKTKIRPLYVPNPTDTGVPNSAIFRVTGGCYFWQFSMFDGDRNGIVYTDNQDFSVNNKSVPLFSHHKLTCFEYADGVNKAGVYDLTDLDMYYGKLSNAYNVASGRDIDSKYPADPEGFEKQRPEWEIVGAFATDPINISSIQAGAGGVASNIVTVETNVQHELQVGTPIKIRGVDVSDYNVSTVVQTVDPNNTRKFTYLLPKFREDLPTPAGASSATVTIETDTVEGASPYIFNCSLRSVYGMCGMKADGSKASGFRSMVVAQFTGVSLQKDDRAFVKYDKSNRSYEGLSISRVAGVDLSNESSSTNAATIYHLDSGAVYRNGWTNSHIDITNDAILQIVSVFAIGYNRHFSAESGGDASITNSNSNFGQLSLVSDGFKKEAFTKDDKAFITNIIPPRAIVSSVEEIDWIPFDVTKTNSVANNKRLYIFGYESEDIIPPVTSQGYRIGAQTNDKVYIDFTNSISSTIGERSSGVLMHIRDGTSASVSGVKEYTVIGYPSSNEFIIGDNTLSTGESVIILSDDGDLPENITPNTVYYAIDQGDNYKIKLASSKSDADNNIPITVYGGTSLRILSRVSDKTAGELGHPVQWDSVQNQWYVNTDVTTNDIYSTLVSYSASLEAYTESTYIKRVPDDRSLDERLYKLRVVIPKESRGSKNPESGFVIQESSTTGYALTSYPTVQSITLSDYEYNRNPRFIATCTFSSSTVSIRAELPHGLDVGDMISIRNVTDSSNPKGVFNDGYNGYYEVKNVPNSMEFTYETTRSLGNGISNDLSVRSISLPRFERNDLQSNLYVYRNETISEYIENQQDGIYHIYALTSDNAITKEFTNLKYSQNVTDLYPQLDRDNVNDSPKSAKTFALRSPIGEVNTSDLKKSLTKTSTDTAVKKLINNLTISSSSALDSDGVSIITFNKDHGLAGIVTFTGLTGGTAHTNGVYYNVKLFNDTSKTIWKGATADCTVSGTSITAADIHSSGSGYANGNTLYFDNAIMGGSVDASITIATSGISTAIGDVVQFTGSGTTADGYYRISSVPATNQIGVFKDKDGEDPIITTDQYAFVIGPSAEITSNQYITEEVEGVPVGISSFSCSSPHGLVAGNRFRIIDSNNKNLGDYLVQSKVGLNTFTAVTNNSGLLPKYVLKHALSANSGVFDKTQESIAIRGISLYNNEILTVIEFSDANSIRVSSPVSGLAITKRFPLGSYIQIGDEIMRIKSSSLSGVNNDEIKVLRGALATRVNVHLPGSLIQKVKPIPVEFRRPSILRASGHTFEYLGYGPGNYSTGLPQVQDRTLNETEEFLSQSQERSAGIVVYTGMNSKGDFYIGNQKKSSATGEEISFDVPVPTITGEIPARLSVAFDEVTIKERLLVEGGDTGQLLSQFDGPVNFSKEVIIKDRLDIRGVLKLTSQENTTSPGTGALVVRGGIGIGKSLSVGGHYLIGSKGAIYKEDGSNNSIIRQFDSGPSNQIKIQSDSLAVLDESGAKKLMVVSNNGGTIIYDGTSDAAANKRIEATTWGTQFTGLTSTSNDLELWNTAGNSSITWDASETSFDLSDNVKATFGDDKDFQIYHNGTLTYFDNNTGHLYIRNNVSGNDGGDIHLQSQSGEDSIICYDNAGVYLHYNGDKKFETISSGSKVTGELQVTGDITAFYSSDERLKDNITPIEDPLAKVISISGNTFNWNEASDKEGQGDTGVIAQEVEKLGLPGTTTIRDDGTHAVRYEKLVPLLIEAVKELSAKVDSLEQSLNNHTSR